MLRPGGRGSLGALTPAGIPGPPTGLRFPGDTDARHFQATSSTGGEIEREFVSTPGSEYRAGSSREILLAGGLAGGISAASVWRPGSPSLQFGLDTSRAGTPEIAKRTEPLLPGAETPDWLGPEARATTSKFATGAPAQIPSRLPPTGGKAVVGDAKKLRSMSGGDATRDRIDAKLDELRKSGAVMPEGRDAAMLRALMGIPGADIRGEHDILAEGAWNYADVKGAGAMAAAGQAAKEKLLGTKLGEWKARTAGKEQADRLAKYLAATGGGAPAAASSGPSSAAPSNAAGFGQLDSTGASASPAGGTSPTQAPTPADDAALFGMGGAPASSPSASAPETVRPPQIGLATGAEDSLAVAPTRSFPGTTLSGLPEATGDAGTGRAAGSRGAAALSAAGRRLVDSGRVSVNTARPPVRSAVLVPGQSLADTALAPADAWPPEPADILRPGAAPAARAVSPVPPVGEASTRPMASAAPEDLAPALDRLDSTGTVRATSAGGLTSGPAGVALAVTPGEAANAPDDDAAEDGPAGSVRGRGAGDLSGVTSPDDGRTPRTPHLSPPQSALDPAATIQAFRDRENTPWKDPPRGKAGEDPRKKLIADAAGRAVGVALRADGSIVGFDVSWIDALPGWSDARKALRQALTAEAQASGSNAADRLKRDITRQIGDALYAQRREAWKKSGKKPPKPRRKDAHEDAAAMVERMLGQDPVRAAPAGASPIACPCPCRPAGGDSPDAPSPEGDGSATFGTTSDAAGGAGATAAGAQDTFATTGPGAPQRWEPESADAAGDTPHVPFVPIGMDGSLEPDGRWKPIMAGDIRILAATGIQRGPKSDWERDAEDTRRATLVTLATDAAERELAFQRFKEAELRRLMRELARKIAPRRLTPDYISKHLAEHAGEIDELLRQRFDLVRGRAGLEAKLDRAAEVNPVGVRYFGLKLMQTDLLITVNDWEIRRLFGTTDHTDIQHLIDCARLVDDATVEFQLGSGTPRTESQWELAHHSRTNGFVRLLAESKSVANEIHKIRYYAGKDLQKGTWTDESRRESRTAARVLSELNDIRDSLASSRPTFTDDLTEWVGSRSQGEIWALVGASVLIGVVTGGVGIAIAGAVSTATGSAALGAVVGMGLAGAASGALSSAADQLISGDARRAGGLDWAEIGRSAILEGSFAAVLGPFSKAARGATLGQHAATRRIKEGWSIAQQYVDGVRSMKDRVARSLSSLSSPGKVLRASATRFGQVSVEEATSELVLDGRLKLALMKDYAKRGLAKYAEGARKKLQEAYKLKYGLQHDWQVSQHMRDEAKRLLAARGKDPSLIENMRLDHIQDICIGGVFEDPHNWQRLLPDANDTLGGLFGNELKKLANGELIDDFQIGGALGDLLTGTDWRDLYGITYELTGMGGASGVLSPAVMAATGSSPEFVVQPAYPENADGWR